MNKETLNWLRRDGSEMPSDICPVLGQLVYDWRDRLQTEENRILLTDDLILEKSNNILKIEDRKNQLLNWINNVLNNIIFPISNIISLEDLESKVLIALSTDTLKPFPEVHDALGAAGIITICSLLNINNILINCISSLRLCTTNFTDTIIIIQQSLRQLIINLLQ